MDTRAKLEQRIAAGKAKGEDVSKFEDALTKLPPVVEASPDGADAAAPAKPKAKRQAKAPKSDAEKTAKTKTAKQPKQAKSKKEPAEPTGEEVWSLDDVRLVKIGGKPTVFVTFRGDAEVDRQECAPQSWKKTQQVLINRLAPQQPQAAASA
jgi:hypothetical protein